MPTSRFRQLFVTLYRILVNIILCILFVVGFGLRYHNLLALNQTLVVVLSTFIVVSIFMTQIYGKLEIGAQKNKPIFYSFILNVLVTDIVAFLSIRVMNISENKSIVIDLLCLLLIFVVQIIIFKLLIKLGNFLYFVKYQPSKVVIINNNSKYIYIRLFDILEVINYNMI